jgi:hypothetical protein
VFYLKNSGCIYSIESHPVKFAIARMVASSNNFPTRVILVGALFLSKPVGILIAGSRLNS